MKRGVIVLAHGSRRRETSRCFEETLERLASRLPGVEVRPAYLELAVPSFREQLERMAGEGYTSVTVLPYFLHSGAHVTRDLPAEARRFRGDFPRVELTVAPPLEGDPLLEDLLAARISEVVGADHGDVR